MALIWHSLLPRSQKIITSRRTALRPPTLLCAHSSGTGQRREKRATRRCADARPARAHSSSHFIFLRRSPRFASRLLPNPLLLSSLSRSHSSILLSANTAYIASVSAPWLHLADCVRGFLILRPCVRWLDLVDSCSRLHSISTRSLPCDNICFVFFVMCRKRVSKPSNSG